MVSSIDQQVLLFDPDNNLVYVSDTVNNRIQVFDSDGNFVAKWGSGNSQLNRPDGIRFEPTEKLIYVTDRKNHGIQVFDSEGTVHTKGTFLDIQSERQIKPRDITIDSLGQIYVVDKENNNILVYGQGEALLSSDIFAGHRSRDRSNDGPSISEKILSCVFWDSSINYSYFFDYFGFYVQSVKRSN